ncbi:MAG: LamG domain-containing protein [Chitinophagales bacterium]|nr:LamG domain-containing protein [Chitinophagales bacterium]
MKRVFMIVHCCLAVIIFSCQKKEASPQPSPPPTNSSVVSVSTTPISDTALTYCTSGATVAISSGTAQINNRGLVWSTSRNPDISLSTKTEESNNSFTRRIVGLLPNTTYYIRAYATTSVGVVYGNELTCTTKNAPVTNGLIAYYPFNGNAKNWVDTANNGEITNATLIADRRNNANAAYNFNGTSAFIDFGINNNIGPTTKTPISISLWLSAGATGNVISKYLNLDASRSYFYFGRSNSNISWIGNGTNPYISLSTTPDTEWTHYVLLAEAGANNAKVYRNGKLIGTGTLAMNASMSNTSLVIGKVSGAFPGFLKGSVDDVSIFNRILTESEITALYNN